VVFVLQAHCVITQKRAVLIYFVLEAWKHTFVTFYFGIGFRAVC